MQFSLSSICATVTIISLLGTAAAQKKYPKDENGNTIYPEMMYIKDGQGKVRLENMTEEAESFAILPTQVLEEDIILYLHTRMNMHNRTAMGVNDLDILRKSSFDRNKKTMFVAHGWTCDCNHETVTVIINAAIAASDMNVFCVDWSKHADGLYVSTAKHAIPEVGRFLAVFLNRIINEYYVKPLSITLVGHSLGAHVVGRAGALQEKKSYIVGLDPAGPMFQMWNYEGKIDKTDGAFVQILHTNAGFLGYDADMGHADYYANDGTRQPGCGLKLLPIDIIGCSHNRSPIYYAESLGSGVFRSLACNGTWTDYKRGKCVGNPMSHFGGLLIDINAQGRYYFKTYDEYPFAQD